MKRKDRILSADAGMLLTNGADFGKSVVLAVGADASCWREITEEEAAAMEHVPAELALAELMEVLA